MFFAPRSSIAPFMSNNIPKGLRRRDTSTASAPSAPRSAAAVSGWGIVYLASGDEAYVSGAPQVVARGALILECEPDQSKLIQVEGG